MYYYVLAPSTSAVVEPPSSCIDFSPVSSQSVNTVKENLTSDMRVS